MSPSTLCGSATWATSSCHSSEWCCSQSGAGPQTCLLRARHRLGPGGKSTNHGREKIKRDTERAGGPRPHGGEPKATEGRVARAVHAVTALSPGCRWKNPESSCPAVPSVPEPPQTQRYPLRRQKVEGQGTSLTSPQPVSSPAE